MKIFLQARVNSKRFPKKVLKEIYKKKNSLEIIIDKISKIGYKNDLVVLTSNKKSDNLIKTFCKKKKIMMINTWKQLRRLHCINSKFFNIK